MKSNAERQNNIITIILHSITDEIMLFQHLPFSNVYRTLLFTACYTFARQVRISPLQNFLAALQNPNIPRQASGCYDDAGPLRNDVRLLKCTSPSEIMLLVYLHDLNYIFSYPRNINVKIINK